MDVNPLVVREAVTSVALSHPDECACYICKAATGDEEALSRVIEDLEFLNDEEPNDNSVLTYN